MAKENEDDGWTPKSGPYHVSHAILRWIIEYVPLPMYIDNTARA